MLSSSAVSSASPRSANAFLQKGSYGAIGPILLLGEYTVEASLSDDTGV
jgi:hypothetical protein